MLEDTGPVAALGRSHDLTSSHLLTVFGVAAFPFGVLVVVTAGVVAATGGPPSSLASREELVALRNALRIAGAVATLLADPVSVTANAVLFAMYERGGPLGGDREGRDRRRRSSDASGRAESAWDDWDST
jgi:hypothetical protein